MSSRRDLCYDRRRRNGSYPAAAAVGCPECGYCALVVSIDPTVTPTAALDALIASDCLGCPRCWADLDLYLTAAPLRDRAGTPG